MGVLLLQRRHAPTEAEAEDPVSKLLALVVVHEFVVVAVGLLAQPARASTAERVTGCNLEGANLTNATAPRGMHDAHSQQMLADMAELDVVAAAGLLLAVVHAVDVFARA
jgi:hypothetical protein